MNSHVVLLRSQSQRQKEGNTQHLLVPFAERGSARLNYMADLLPPGLQDSLKLIRVLVNERVFLVVETRIVEHQLKVINDVLFTGVLRRYKYIKQYHNN